MDWNATNNPRLNRYDQTGAAQTIGGYSDSLPQLIRAADETLRERCLTWALSSTGTPEDVVARAGAYFNFIKGEAKTNG